ncbi:MAG: hypothetical protein ABSA21_13540 [Candidatus Limnocylindrales bacterium]|jgi:hypothetical protein
MATAPPVFEEQRSDFQFGPYVVWSEFVPLWSIEVEEVGVRAMYGRLAAAHDAEPTVPDLGGGVPGDLYQL